jgi:hypothetical protein
MKKYELSEDNGQWRYRCEGVEWQWGSNDRDETEAQAVGRFGPGLFHLCGEADTLNT